MDPLTIGSLAIGVLGLAAIPLSIIFAKRSRQTPDLRVARDFDEVVSPGDWLLRGGIVITFDGKVLERVSRTYFAIWNHRGDTVRGSEVLDADPLRVELPEGDEVLQARVVTSSRTQIGVDVHPEGRTASVTFDFMDSGDGAVIEVLHTGDQPASLVGTIPGARLGRARTAVLSPSGRRRVRLNPFRRLIDGRRLVPGIGMLVSLAAYLGLIGFYWTRYLAKDAALPLDSDEYNLATLDGQREFASAVTASGNGSSIDPTLLAVTLAFAVFMIASTAVLIFRTPVPPKIVAHDADPDPEAKATRKRRPRTED